MYSTSIFLTSTTKTTDYPTFCQYIIEDFVVIWFSLCDFCPKLTLCGKQFLYHLDLFFHRQDFLTMSQEKVEIDD